MNEKQLIKISSLKYLRPVALYILRLTARDFEFKNPYSQLKIKVNSYKHKGYWFFRGYREEATIKSIKKLVKDGSTVIEVGGHIGFISHLYSSLVGEKGKLFVFEPGDNVLNYTRKNLSMLKNTVLVEKACGNMNGIISFFKDGMSGQNNSLLGDYENVEAVAATHGMKAERIETKVDIIRLEDFISAEDIIVNHVKIDVEGAEKEVLLGLNGYLGKIPSFMIEITRNTEDVYSLMRANGYSAYDDNLNLLSNGDLRSGNIFFVLDQ